ncbi:MAG TPA: NAD-dependent epimerase/dehydratase family protein [Atribacteraceae bacterium]|nr:NAD-dependent epimerase/dehydratase family protein [Atribacteraceae bacterium]
MSNYLVTGCAGFIGSVVTERLLRDGHTVTGVDNLNDYYDIRLKEYRLARLRDQVGLRDVRGDIEDRASLRKVFEEGGAFDAVVNLAARTGVRASLRDPGSYLATNVMGTLHLLELSREYGVPKFVLASTSSLYAGQKMPFREELPVNTPISPYAVSKKGAEILAYTWHYLYGIDVSVVRYFTVYGPAGRPDMSIFRFIRWIAEGETVVLFGDGTQSRDFTYVEDVARGTVAALRRVGFATVNLGSDSPHTLNEVIGRIEKLAGKQAVIEHRDFPRTDVPATWAHIGKARELLGWQPEVSLGEGLRRTVEWYLEHRGFAKTLSLDEFPGRC